MSFLFSSRSCSFSWEISLARRNRSRKPVIEPLKPEVSDCTGAVMVPTICSTTVEAPIVMVARSRKANITIHSASSTLKTQL